MGDGGRNGQSEAIALTKATIGFQSILYEHFREKLDCADSIIRKLELTYFAASIVTAIYLRLGKQPNRKQILDLFAKYILEGSITASQEQISFGSAVAQYQKRYAEYDPLLTTFLTSETSPADNPAEPLSHHLFECVTRQNNALKILLLSAYIVNHIFDLIDFVKEL